MKISVVIPVLNELDCLPSTMDSVRESISDPEIIAVDGGSTDGSREWLLRQPDIKTLTSGRGKGPQQNAGGFVARGDVLLFLHADCRLPPDAGRQLERMVSDRSVSGGCFYVQWDDARFSLRLVARGMNLRTRLFHSSYGDQALFVRKSVFENVDGFPDWPLFEDVELLRRFKKMGRFAVIPSPVTLSPRRLLAGGVWRTVALIYGLQLAYWLGVPPARLKRWFRDIRSPRHGTSPPWETSGTDS
jgi:rSAM/selenodomain-associated transferase 2